MVFEYLIQQTAADFGGSVSGSIGSIAILISVLAPLVVFFANKFLTGKLKEDTIKYAQISMLGAQKATESKDRIKSTLNILAESVPQEQKPLLDKIAAEADNVTEEVDKGVAQIVKLKKLYPEIDADNLAVPRESFDTLPQVNK